MKAISMVLLDQFTHLALLILLEKTNLLFDIFLRKQVLVLLLSLVQPFTNLLLANFDIWVFLLTHIFINEHRRVRFSSETVIEDLIPAAEHGIDLLIIEQDPLALLSDVDIVVVVAEDYHGSENEWGCFTAHSVKIIEHHILWY